MSLSVDAIKEEIHRIYLDIQYLKNNRISKEMIRRHSRLKTSKEFKAMVKDQKSLENNAFKIWRERIRALKSLLKHS